MHFGVDPSELWTASASLAEAATVASAARADVTALPAASCWTDDPALQARARRAFERLDELSLAATESLEELAAELASAAERYVHSDQAWFR
jgi:hypothetical protein